MNMGFAPFGVGNGGSSSSFSNLSPLAPPFTLDRSVTKPLSTPLVDITEPEPEPEFGVGVGVGVPLNPLQHNWLPSTSKTSAHDFDWLPFSTGSGYPRSQAMMDPSHNHGPLLGRLTITSTDLSSYHGSSDGVTTSMGKPKPYYPSYAATSSNKAGPTAIVDQPSYDWLSNSHVVKFKGPPCTDFSRGSSASERSTKEASHSVDVLDLNKCNDFVREYPNEELFSERNLNIERISNMDAHSAFPGCHPKTRTPPSNPASSSQNSPFLKKPPYLEISREQDSRLNVTTSIVNSPATFSIRPSVVSTDSFAWNVGSCHVSDYGYEAKQGGNNLSNLKELLPVNSESKEFVSAENYDTCIDKNDPVITEPSSTKIHDLRNNIHSAKDSPDRRLKAGMRLHIPDASPHFSLDPKGIETATTTESSSESFDQYNLAAVDSPCWKGVPINQISPFQAFEIVTPSRTKMLEVYNSVNLSLSQVPPSTAEDTVKVIVHEPNESTIGSILEKGATSSPKMPSVIVPAEQKSSNSVKAGEFCSKMGCFHPATSSVYETFEDGGDFYSSCSIPQNKYKHNLVSGKRIGRTSCTEKHADARLNSDNSSGNGLNHLSFDAAEHVQNLPSELVKAFHGESTSKVDIRILVDTLHSLSELLLAHCSNGLDALHQKDVMSLETVMNNLDVCINSVGSQGSLSPEQRTSQSLEQFHQLHAHFQDLGVLKSQSQMTKIEGENLECLSNDRNGVEETNRHILSVKKDKEAAGSHHLRNGIDSMKEDSMTKALKKVLSENFHDDEEHPQTLLYKNLWLQAEAALCASNLRARFNSAKSEMEKHESPKVKEHAKNHNQLFVSGASPGSNTIAEVASKTKVGSTSFVSVQTSPTVSVRSHASDDVITRFNILKHRDDEAKLRDAENSGTLSDFEVSVKQGMVEKSALEKEQTAGPHMKDMDSSFPSSKVKGNDSGPAPRSTSPILTRTSHIDDVMSRFQILKSRDERVSSLNAGKVQKVTSSRCSEIEKAALEGAISMIHHPVADNKNEVDDLDGSVMGRLDVLRSRGNNIRPTPAGENLQEYWTSVENKVKMEPFLRPEAGKDSRSHFEGKLPAGCSNGSSSDWEHVLWCD
ncbi:uncharacterized protein LOC111801731 isoform X1 [Cucurbita pepo subsp. pepo]|uniref:uncharacterized protein LOC111801731 isoform X1 n=1 Tax=Cucurbita pepo subsp. pepo TaxID=3664 RepID=UPI000C9D3FA0|nr:uncharacterized protein LOC111801731 isoform X1 [Cucurbita pepo subsp. pepo]